MMLAWFLFLFLLDAAVAFCPHRAVLGGAAAATSTTSTTTTIGALKPATHDSFSSSSLLILRSTTEGDEGTSNDDMPEISAGEEGTPPTGKVLSVTAKCLKLVNIFHKNVIKRKEPKQPQPALTTMSLRQGRKRRSFAYWTRTKTMKRLTEWAFEICDVEGTGRIDQRSFYTGLLLVHLNLAKYAGVAACSPPSREQVEELFALADQDRTGLLNQQEFTNAIVVSSARITSRIMIYWSVIVFVVPAVVERTVKLVVPLIHPSDQSRPLIRQLLLTLEWIVQYMVTFTFFSILVPRVFGQIDSYSNRLVKQTKNPKYWWEAWGNPLSTDKNGKGEDTRSKSKS